MGRLAPRARAYLLSVLACAALLLYVMMPLSSQPTPRDLLLCVTLGLGLVVGYLCPIELSHTTKLNVSTALEFALPLMVGPELAVWTVVVSFALTSFWRLRRAWRWYHMAFNASNAVISVGVAGLVYQQASGGVPLFSSDISALAVVMAGITYFFLNIGALATMVALANSSEALGSFLSAFQGAAPQFLGLLVLGVVGAAVYTASPVAAALLVIPLLGVYFSLRSSLTLRTETKRAIEALAIEVDQYHPYTAQHSERVAYFAGKICRKLQLSEDQADTITRAARIHDLGKLSIWRGMLNKPTALTPKELEELHTHPARGAELVSRFPDYRNGRDLILHHHERYDGQGYPDGLKGEAIPLGARIIAVADATDAMMSDRPYRRALSIAETMGELERHRSRQFDPLVVDLMLGILEVEARTVGWRGTARTAATA